MLQMWEFAAYPLLALMFVGIFTREVIAPASRNHCDRRWLILSTLLGLGTLATTLAVGHLFSDGIRRHALLDVGRQWPAWAVGALSFVLTSFVFTGGTAPRTGRTRCGACSTSCTTARRAWRRSRRFSPIPWTRPPPCC